MSYVLARHVAKWPAGSGRGLGAGLGEYCNDYGCFSYDLARGAYVNGDGKTEDEVRGATVKTSPGSTPNATGGVNYSAASNPLLISDPTGTDLFGGTQHFNPDFYATLSAAQKFAAALGGTVVNDPTAANFNQAQPMYAVRLPNGATVNAGAIAEILNNDANGANDGADSGLLASLLGVNYNPQLAASLRAGSSIQLTGASAPAPGYSVALWSGATPKAPAPPSGSVVTSSNSAGSAPGGGAPAGGAPAGGAPPPAPPLSSFSLEDVPVWGWAVAAGALIFFFSRNQ